MNNLSKELIGASTIPLILSILTNGENYGYEIIQEIKKLSENKIQWSDGTIYPVLHKMEKNGLIKSSWKNSKVGRKRKYYRILKAGNVALKNEKHSWELVQQIMTKLWKVEPNLI
jgi:PadR family transcriptional regulator